MEDNITSKINIEKCYDIFIEKLYDSKGDPISCSLHEVFTNEEIHNCLGCNFMESIDLITNFLENYKVRCDNFDKYNFPIYLFLFYLTIERVDFILDILNIKNEEKNKIFETFQKIKKWANFFKHPKSFLLVHHPWFYFEPYDKKEDKFIIDSAFVSKYYPGDNSDLENKLKNKTDVHVVFPNPFDLTKSFTKEFIIFINLLKNTPEYKCILNDKFTISNYIKNLEDY